MVYKQRKLMKYRIMRHVGCDTGPRIIVVLCLPQVVNCQGIDNSWQHDSTVARLLETT